MAFADANHVNVSDATFNDVGQNQYSFHTTNVHFAPPRLALAFSSAEFISSLVPYVEMSQQQMKALSISVKTLLETLHAEYSAGRLVESLTSAALDKLHWSVPGSITAHSLLME
jgi:hypothetical protein